MADRVQVVVIAPTQRHFTAWYFEIGFTTLVDFIHVTKIEDVHGHNFSAVVVLQPVNELSREHHKILGEVEDSIAR